MSDYSTFIKSKARQLAASGFQCEVACDYLFPFQSSIVSWALMRGRAAIFADTGLGKTRMQVRWAAEVARHDGGRVLILAPLSVTTQTVAEAASLGIEIGIVRHTDYGESIVATNYENLHNVDTDAFVGVVLDESSILKSVDGKTRNTLIAAFSRTLYRLACTATPAPNDYTELGNHAAFLGVMTHAEMLSMFFVHDGGSTQDWRLKGHAQQAFWAWVCEWASVVRDPADIGFDGSMYRLPPLSVELHTTPSKAAKRGMLFTTQVSDLSERRSERRASVSDRVAKTAAIVMQSDAPCIVWCNLNEEADECESAIPGAIQITGSDSPEEKEASMARFLSGSVKVLVTKPKIAGFGINMQHCARMVFCGLSDSFEAYYQAVRRCWRFGQKHPVHVHIVLTESERSVYDNVAGKQDAFDIMGREVVAMTRTLTARNLKPQGFRMTSDSYATDTATGDGWTLHLGDCVEVAKTLADDSIDYSIFSPPFASLYTYSASERDMGNCSDGDEFLTHFGFLVRELMRVTRPGRLLSFHCMDLPTSKTRDGYIGIRDFRGELVRIFQHHGWIYHSVVTIWKDPVTAMQRTKALGLLHKQLKKDSCMSRQGIPDYLITMRKPGTNGKPVTHTNDSFPVREWQDYASPVWMDINPSDTLQASSAREDDDERHICPLQLEVIRRALRLWSMPDDLVLSPFAGIGSEGFEAVKAGRRFVGIELKKVYWAQAAKNLARAVADGKQRTLFDAPSKGIV